MEGDSHVSKMFANCFPISIAISARSTYKDVDVWLGDYSSMEAQKVVSVPYIEGLIAGKSPDAIYDATVRIPNLDAISIDDGYRFRFQTKTWWQLEEFLKALSNASDAADVPTAR